MKNLGTVLVNFSMRPHQKDRLEKYALRHGMKKSHVIQSFIERFCNMESCYNCQESFYNSHREKLARGYSIQDVQKNLGLNNETIIRPALFVFHVKYSGFDLFQCSECSGLHDDIQANMLITREPRITPAGTYTLLPSVPREDLNRILNENVSRLEERYKTILNESDYQKRQDEKTKSFREREEAREREILEATLTGSSPGKAVEGTKKGKKSGA